MAAFIGAAVRPPSALARAIVVVLTIKLVAIATMAIYFHFYDRHVVADAAAVGRLLGPATAP